RIVTSVQAGAVVILESGAAFASRQDRRAHCDALRSLEVRVGAPVHLWPRCTPYVDYQWPRAAKLRDFSRVIPLADHAGEAIGWIDGLQVALRRQVGRGSFIFLGSPLGPALWAGDADAKRWLLDVVRS
ncbi:MAG TPA: hypothetical protein VGU74_06195, partial [Gemmatimonadales bacterium]|nr:hypothetical protein [Gemmatimonadales bacterium]